MAPLRPLLVTAMASALASANVTTNELASATVITRFQDWKLRTMNSTGANALAITLAGTKKCLDLRGGNTDNGTPVELWDCNGLKNQNWVFAAGSYKIQYAADTSMCIDNIGGGGQGNLLAIWKCTGGANQVWGYDPKMQTIYLASSQSNAKWCMDVPGGDTKNGNQIEIWGCNGHSNQRWAIGGPSPGPPPPTPGGGCYAKTGISATQLNCVYPKLDAGSAARYAGELNSWMGDSLTNACKWAAFLANVGTESAELTEWTQVPCSAATGAPYCGRGPLQITGSSNYAYCARQGVCKCPDISSQPTEVSQDENVGMGTASCVWKALAGHDLSGDADGSRSPGLLKTACYINAGHYPCGTPNGWASRQAYWEAANKCLGV